jgi:capsular polysaccharide biosynthesis protein
MTYGLGESMEYEIDLGRYLRALGRRWFWMLAAGVICAVVAGGVYLMLPVRYTASSTVFFRPTRSQVRLDERFVTDATIDIASQRTTLLILAKSPGIAALVPEETLARLGLAGKSATEIADTIDASATGDLISIFASATTPEQARGLSDAWAEAFVARANELYAQSAPPVNNEQVEARYAAAQKAFEQFTGSNRTSELDQRITATESVITRTL